MKKIIVAFLLCFGLGFAAGVVDAAPVVRGQAKTMSVKAKAPEKKVVKPQIGKRVEAQAAKARKANKKMTFPKKALAPIVKPVVKKAGK